MNILVSACLLGIYCRYDGKTKEYPEIKELSQKHTLIPVCPEQLGGLPTPRNPVEICNGKVVDCDGKDFTQEFINGSESVLKIAEITNSNFAILKSNSPSCGFGQIYDGTFSKKLIKGNGITAELLISNGITVRNEMNF